MPEARVPQQMKTEYDALLGELAEARVLVKGGVLQFQALADCMNQGAALLTADGVIRFANDRLSALFGRAPGQLKGSPLADLLPPDQRRPFRTLIRESLLQACVGVSSVGMFLLSGSEGRETPYRFSCVPAPEDGTTVIVLTATELPGSMAAAAWQANPPAVQTVPDVDYRRLIESIPDPVCWIDGEGKIRYANAAIKRFGWTPEEVVGKPLDELVSADSRDNLRAARGDTERGGARSVHLSLLCRSGETAAVQAVMGTLTGADRKSGLCVVLSRTDHEPRSRQDFPGAAEPGFPGSLGGFVAHGFNNIFQIIVGCTEVCLGMAGDDSPMAAHLGEVLRAVSRGAQMTQKLLALTRQQTPGIEQFDLNALVRAGDESFGLLAGAGIDVSLDLDPGLAPTLSEAGRIQELLIQLVRSARDAMRRKGTLRIETRNAWLETDAPVLPSVSKRGTFVALSITDSGPDAGGQTRRRLMDVCFSPTGPGGPALPGVVPALSIMDVCRGHMEVHSERGRGSTVTLFLPAAD